MTLVPLVARLFDVPVQPGADEARAWLENELNDPVYHRSPSLLQRLLDWLAGLFRDAPALALPPRTAVLVVVAVLNLASERVSFSRVIGAVPPLRAADRWGRLP